MTELEPLEAVIFSPSQDDLEAECASEGFISSTVKGTSLGKKDDPDVL
jgi:hypothetical protein